jgi:transcriptional regulator with XRE-family HTH domain
MNEETGLMMSAQQLKTWRKARGLKQRELATLLGMKRRAIQYYEKGERDGRPVEVPTYVRLACWALHDGVIDFDGQKITKG